MTFKFAIVAAVALGLFTATGAALAQAQDQSAFYGDTVLPDPPQKAAHVFAAALATQDVATVTPAAAAPDGMATPLPPQRATVCTRLSPCAFVAPAARG